MRHFRVLVTVFLTITFALMTPFALNADWGKKGGGHHGWGGRGGHHGWGKHHRPPWKEGHNRLILTQKDDGTWAASVRGKDTRVRVIFPDFPQYTSLGEGASEFEVFDQESAYTFQFYKDLQSIKSQLKVKSNAELATALARSDRFTPMKAGSWVYEEQFISNEPATDASKFDMFEFGAKGSLSNQDFLVRQVRVLVSKTSAFVVVETHYTTSGQDAEAAKGNYQESDAVLELSDTPFMDNIEVNTPDDEDALIPYDR